MQQRFIRGRAIALMLLLFATAFNLLGQDREVGLGGDAVGDGNNAILGTLRRPSGQKLNLRVTVQLSTPRGNFTTYSDANGSFVFSGLRSGTYRITIDAGKEFELANETVEIAQSPRTSGSTYTVDVQLRLKAVEITPPGVVDISLVGIPKPALDLYGEALKAKQKGDLKKAIEQLKEAVWLHAEFMLAFNELGLLYMQTNQLEEAETALQAALKLAPNAFPPIFNHGLLMTQKRQFDIAETWLRRAVALNESSAPAHLYLGRVLVSLQKYDDAEKHLLRSILLGGEGFALAHRFLGALYLEQGKNEQGVKELEKYLKLEPNAKDARRLRETIKRLRNTPPGQ
jgi:Tfp pilus assembly protein PilF